MSAAAYRADMLTGLDVEKARWGIGRDLDELDAAGLFGWLMVAGTFGLPLISLALLLARRWLAVVPLAISGGLFAVWFLYYATDWWSNPGMNGAAQAGLVLLLGWAIVIDELRRPRRDPG
ncbi:MAG: hypothetical protein M3R26_04550 [Actinomycetota bacterium]|nr:hypothetical protein [Actinomycetota bacterium]